MEETKNLPFAHLAQKRRSSVSELAAYLQDMLEDGESNRMISTNPGWLFNVPPSQGGCSGEVLFGGPGCGDGGSGGRDGNGNGTVNNSAQPRVTFKRDHGEDVNEAYGGGGGGGGDEGETVLGGTGRGFKRVKGPPLPAPAFDTPSAVEMGRGGGGPRGGVGPGAGEAKAPGLAIRKMSERRTSEGGRIGLGASPTVVQALTCLASQLNSSSSDSEGERDGDQLPAVGTGAGARRGHEGSPWAGGSASAAAAGGGGDVSRNISNEEDAPSPAAGERGKKGMEVSVKVEEGGSAVGASTGPAGRAEAGNGKVDGGGGGGASAGESAGGGSSSSGGTCSKNARREVGGEEEKAVEPGRRHGNPIADVLTNFSIDRALEQLKSDKSGDGSGGGGGGEAEGEGEGGEDDNEEGSSQPTMRQRASVYVLMHAIAAVDTANGEEWEGDDIIDGAEAATVAAAI